MPALAKNCINLKSRQLARLTTRHYEAELSKVGLKATQFTLLSKVLRLGPVGLSDLARNMAVEPSTLSRNIQPLLRQGWLRIETGADARYRVLRITETGKRKQAEADHHWAIAQNNVTALLGEEHVAALHRLLDTCLAKLSDKGD